MIGPTILRRTRQATVLLAAAAVVAVLLALLSGASPAQAAFPGINGPIVFSSDGDIYSFRPGDAETRQLTFSSSLREFDPKWSPDGTKVAFTGDTSGGGFGGIYVMNANGIGARTVTDGPEGEYDSEYDPSWSPDGRSLIYVKQANDVSNIYTVNLDGTGETRITNNTSIFVGFDDPAYSPDGTKIAYSRRDGASSLSDDDTFVANADGSGAVRVSPFRRGHYSFSGWEPGWSPDGTRVVFFESLHFERSSGGAYGNQEIYVANRDGSGLTNLTNTTAEAYDQDETSPAWSPDGTRIAFMSGAESGYTNGSSRINYMNANGSGRVSGPLLPFKYAQDLDWGVSAADMAGPAFSAPKPSHGASTRDRTPAVSVKVSDDLTRLIESDIKLYVDGTEKPMSAFAYYPSTETLKYPSSRLSYGKHTVKVEATDAAGNRTSTSWSFKVAR